MISIESLYLETPAGFSVRQDDERLFDAQDPSKRVIMLEETERLRAALGNMPLRERKLLRLRYGLDQEPQSLARIAKAFNVTKPCIAKREKAALARARSLIVKTETGIKL